MARANLVRQVFTANGTWTAPGGVYRARITATPQNTGPLVITSAGAMLINGGDRTAWAWGNNSAPGNLGVGTSTVAYSSPVQVVGGLPQITRLIMDNSNCSAFLDVNGDIWTVGLNSNGQLGIGSTTSPFSSPQKVIGSIKFADLPKGGMQPNQPFTGSFGALDISGNIWMWGQNNDGMSGQNVSPAVTVAYSSPVKVVGGVSFVKFSIVNSSGKFAAGIDNSGNMYCWGRNTKGQCGNNTTTSAYSSPVKVVGGLVFTDFIIDAQNTNAVVYALDNANQLWAWGDNTAGACGQGSTATSAYSSPVKVVGGISWASLMTGTCTSGGMFGIDTAGNAWSFGVNINAYGGSGNNVSPGVTASYSSPVKVVGGLVFTSICTGGGNSQQFVAAIDNANNMWVWGANINGIGNNVGPQTTVAYSSPVQVVGGISWAAVFPDTNYSNTNSWLGVDTQGNVWACGSNANGVCGNNVSPGTTAAYSSPVQVVGNKSFQSNIPPIVTSIDVVPGTAYAVSLFPAYVAYFGSTPIGKQVASVAVEYFQ